MQQTINKQITTDADVSISINATAWWTPMTIIFAAPQPFVFSLLSSAHKWKSVENNSLLAIPQATHS